MNMYLSILEPSFILQMSQPRKITQNWFCNQNLQFLEGKKRFRNLFIGSRDIKKTNILKFFLKRPVELLI